MVALGSIGVGIFVGHGNFICLSPIFPALLPKTNAVSGVILA